MRYSIQRCVLWISVGAALVSCAQPKQPSFLDQLAALAGKIDPASLERQLHDPPPRDDLGLSLSEFAQITSAVLGKTSEPILWMARPDRGDRIYVYTGHHDASGGSGESFILDRRDGEWVLFEDKVIKSWAAYP